MRNPSAYVVKAVGNARRQLEGGGRFYGGGPPGGPPRGYGGGYGRPPMHGQPPAPRGYGAPQQPFGPTGQQLDYPGGHYYEHHAAPPPSQPFDTDAAVAAEYAHLDQKAVAALRPLPALQSTQILLELRRKSGAIRNPSAYVWKCARDGERRRGHGARHGAVAAVRPVSSTAAAAAVPVRPAQPHRYVMRATANAAAGTVPDTARSPQYAQYHQQQQQQYQIPVPTAPSRPARPGYQPPRLYGTAPGAAPDYAAYADAEAAYAAYAAGGQPASAQPPTAPEPAPVPRTVLAGVRA